MIDPNDSSDNDPLDVARGIIHAVIIGFCAWLLIIGIALYLR